MPTPNTKVQRSLVELTDDDARLAFDALRRIADVPSFPLAREARSAFRKLAFDLDPAVFSGAPVGCRLIERSGQMNDS